MPRRHPGAAKWKLAKGHEKDPIARNKPARMGHPKSFFGIKARPPANVIERCFVEVRRRTRPMVVFTNVESVDRIIYAIFSRFNEDWKNHTLELFAQAA